jgi:hypothetical protein
MPDETGHYLNEEMLHCIEVCSDCHKACLQTVPYCLQMGGHHAEPNHIRLMMDCAEICQTSANFMLRGSERHQLTCRVCADICRACAEGCERMGSDDEMMQQCAEECRRCQQSCERMAS